MKYLFLVEHDYQVEDFLNRGMKDKGIWVALGPSAMHALSNKGISFTIPEDYCSLEEIENACVTQFERLKQVYNKMDEILFQRDPFLKEWGIQPLFFHLWQLGMIFDAVVSRSLWLKKILESYPNAKVYVHLAPPQPWSIFGIGFHNKETLWARLLTIPRWNNEIVSLPNPTFEQTLINNDTFIKIAMGYLNKNVKKKIGLSLKVMSILLSFRNNISANILRLFNLISLNKRSNLLVLSVYDWKHLLPIFLKDEWRIFFFNDYFSDNKGKIIDKPRWNEETELLWNKFHNMLGIDQYGYTSLIKDRICWIIQESQKVAQQIIEKMETMIINRGISFVLSTGLPRYEHYIAENYFIQKGIPVIHFQHGSVWYDNHITQRGDYIDMLSANILLTYGDGVKKAYESSDLRACCKIESIGSLNLDRISKKKEGKITKEKTKRILYVITNYYLNVWYCGFSPPFSDRFYYREQATILERLKDMIDKRETISLTIKLCPHSDMINEDPPWVPDLKEISKISLVRYPNFDELLARYDILLIDSPTTTLLQAIATRLPVFVLTSIISPSLADLPLLRKRAVYAESAGELMDELEAYLNSGEYPSDVDNREFLKCFGTHLDDGNSDLRAQAIVKKMLYNN